MNTTFTEYITKHMNDRKKSWYSLLELYAANLAHKNHVIFTRDNDHITYKGKSDSVQLVHDCMADIWHIEIFPTNPHKDIEIINFTNEDDAIAAFTVWSTYMNIVVYEQFKNF